MKQSLVFAVILLSATPARADYFYKLVGYHCDAKANALVVTYAGALNEAGKKMMRQKGPRQWDPWSLIVKAKDGRSVLSVKTVRGQCHLADGTYDITIGPMPGNANLQGACGGFMTAWVEVRRGSEVILRRHAFEHGDCHASGPVTTKIVIEAGGKPPAFTRVPSEDFIK